MKKKEKEIVSEFINSPLNNPMPNYSVYIMSKTERIIARLIAFIAGGLVALVFYGNLFMVDGFATIATHVSNVIVFVVLGILANKFLIPMYKKNVLKREKIY